MPSGSTASSSASPQKRSINPTRSVHHPLPFDARNRLLGTTVMQPENRVVDGCAPDSLVWPIATLYEPKLARVAGPWASGSRRKGVAHLSDFRVGGKFCSEPLPARNQSLGTTVVQAELQLSAPDEPAGRCGPAGMTEFV